MIVRLHSLVLALSLVAALLLGGCPARRSSGNPIDTLDPAFLDRA